MKTVVLDTWTESERGWGCRPDGCSIHLNKQDYNSFVDEYWKNMPNETPDEYSRPDGGLKVVEVSDEIYNDIVKSGYGIRMWQSTFRDYKNNGMIKL